MDSHDHSLNDRHGARQPRRFDPAKAARLDDPTRFTYLPPGEVLALLDAPYEACVVDFGTGTGTYAIAIAGARPDLRVVAVDEQPEMLALLRAKPEAAHLKNLEAVGVEALSALRGVADRVLALNVLHEVGNAALDDLLALLAAGGRAVFIDWNAAVDRPVGPPAAHVYRLEEARARLERHGFTIVAAQTLRFHYALIATR
ncbi:class I SAM-dependent methyltransferase [bacterium]|nr:MAG: class I SAM-dependent methyltransferase [bacterium]